MSNDTTRIVVKWNKIRDGENFPYKRVHGPQFLLQMSGSGLVAPAGIFFNSKFSKFHIGNFTEERFKKIWQSERYWRVMRYLASNQFDPKTMMGSLPIAHYVNVALDRHIRGIERIHEHRGPLPQHHNFL